MMRVRISEDALQDLNEGFLFYEAQELRLGDYFTACRRADIEGLRVSAGPPGVIHRGLRRARKTGSSTPVNNARITYISRWTDDRRRIRDHGSPVRPPGTAVDRRGGREQQDHQHKAVWLRTTAGSSGGNRRSRAQGWHRRSRGLPTTARVSIWRAVGRPSRSGAEGRERRLR